MLEYLEIKITTIEIKDFAGKYIGYRLDYEIGDYLLYDSKTKCFISEQNSNVRIDLVIPTLELFEEALLLLGLGLTLNEIKERLLD